MAMTRPSSGRRDSRRWTYPTPSRPSRDIPARGRARQGKGSGQATETYRQHGPLGLAECGELHHPLPEAERLRYRHHLCS